MAKGEPSRPVESHPEGRPRELVIEVIGDLFRERFQFPTSATSFKESPFTFPDAMRGKGAVRIDTIRSGVALHIEALNNMVESPYFLKGVEGHPRIKIRHHEVLCWDAFPSYLHELGAFPAKDLSRLHPSKVWRISNTLGLIQGESSYDSPDASRDDARQTLEAQIEGASQRLKVACENQTPFILVVNDRGHGFRECEGSITKLLGAINPKVDHLIIWHIRAPQDQKNSFARQLAESRSRKHTIVIVNQQCLRDEGVNIRFDMSYEHTFSDFLSFSRKHYLLKSFLRFPQLLVRFDYGVLHITSGDNLDPAKHVQGTGVGVTKIESVDIHGLVGGPFYISPQRFGMMTGRTFLLVSSLVGEIARWYFRDGQARLIDALVMEGCSNDYSGVSPGAARARHLEHPMGDVSTPSILRNTLIDQSIDIGILLNSLHFYRGFGEFSAGRQPFSEGSHSSRHQFESLFGSFSQQLQRTEPTAEELARGGPIKPFGFLYEHEEPYLTKLTRISVDPDLLSSDPEVTSRRDRFSRVDYIGYKDIIKLSSQKHFFPGEFAAKGHLRFDPDMFEHVLRRIVVYGIDSVLSRDTLGDGRSSSEPSVIVPYVRMGSITTLDRAEIDGFLSIRFLLESYLLNAKAGTRPLSLAVFGPPGSGKNFTVNQILKSVGKVTSAESMTINLSQFTSVAELSRAFHIIQDRALANDVPIAFFDEFDSAKESDPLGWLKFFLAPMQDGKFFDGNDTCHVGPAIFVFGGGTASRFTEFVTKYGNDEAKKAPDFISRLRGHLDIKDIKITSNNDEDKRVKVRRALLLRSLLHERARNVFDETGEVARVDHAVIDAFMHAKAFKHGVRSMEAIIDMARVREAGSFQKSSLPTLAQLDMHVDGREFLNLVNRARDVDLDDDN